MLQTSSMWNQQAQNIFFKKWGFVTSSNYLYCLLVIIINSWLKNCCYELKKQDLLWKTCRISTILSTATPVFSHSAAQPNWFSPPQSAEEQRLFNGLGFQMEKQGCWKFSNQFYWMKSRGKSEEAFLGADQCEQQAADVPGALPMQRDCQPCPDTAAPASTDKICSSAQTSAHFHKSN